jgi:hypothetical protein
VFLDKRIESASSNVSYVLHIKSRAPRSDSHSLAILERDLDSAVVFEIKGKRNERRRANRLLLNWWFSSLLNGD